MRSPLIGRFIVLVTEVTQVTQEERSMYSRRAFFGVKSRGNGSEKRRAVTNENPA